ncbi:L-seryl-tRNA(Sec) selenium transferase [Desulfofundulus australicus DSM 11792]|uniref:L-seryl-tRNA(Sec) selenium transferase n=1 Tax=Desulfofundulus australicus DSM 11792 TaxID=1121425 RepID=A0A1M5B2F4_9FIRM|nr:L-seryl-tRNA(Sec) selenium transferase [Desulfofundulus australicus]SHF36673.1 L-seryl-tRNA(Sec) selenium transferase [Desulfofundulus australicus DSM 11792]
MENKEVLRKLPAVDEILRRQEIADLLVENPRNLVVEIIRDVLDRWRQVLLTGEVKEETGRAEITSLVAKEVIRETARRSRPSLRRVINATGVVLHTNLGRAVLARAARAAVEMVASGYCNLELDLQSGRRGSRYAHLEALLINLTGAEAAMVVNNNAAAVLLALSTLARGREVIVSRGQLVEIGGSFRIPEVMAQSGAILVEVGATNKTYPDDYRRAINERTALLLHVHTSNYRLVGFVREITVKELVALGKEYGLPVMSDLGSGFLVDLGQLGLPAEPTVQEIVSSGVDVVTFSGDKLLGGPQAGIIVGRRQFIEKMKKNPLTRAIRIDKFTAASLEATLRLYLEPAKALEQIPTLRMLTAGLAELEDRARKLAEQIRQKVGNKATIELLPVISRVGGGAMPTAELPSMAVSIRPGQIDSENLASILRNGEPAIMGRVQDERLLLDIRTILPGEEEILIQAITAAFQAVEEVEK